MEKGCKNQKQTTDKRTDVWSRDFMIWRINFGLWAVAWAGLWEKRVWAVYEQLLRHFFGVNFFSIFFWKHHRVRTEKLHWKKVKKKCLFFGIFSLQKNNIFLGLKMPLSVQWDREQTTVGYTVQYRVIIWSLELVFSAWIFSNFKLKKIYQKLIMVISKKKIVSW